MALHKLQLDDFNDDEYILIAIHSRIEDYRLAFLLNKYLNLRLSKKEKDIDLNYMKSSYTIYEWNNESDCVTWNLVSNRCVKEEEALFSSGILFKDETKTLKTYHLLPELKNVDFLLKISDEVQSINEKKLLKELQKIQQIITTYSVNQTKLKSRENIIF